MLSAALLAAEESAAVVNQLPMEPVMYGVVAFAGLLSMLAVTFAFRNVWTRH